MQLALFSGRSETLLHIPCELEMDNGVEKFSVCNFLLLTPPPPKIVWAQGRTIKTSSWFHVATLRYCSIFGDVWVSINILLWVDFCRQGSNYGRLDVAVLICHYAERAKAELCALLSALVAKVSLWFPFLGSGSAFKNLLANFNGDGFSSLFF